MNVGTVGDYGYESNLIRYDLVGKHSYSEIEQAQYALEASLTPMPIEKLVIEVTRLRTMTRSRPETQVDMEAQLMIFSEMLEEYPEDIVMEVVRSWPRKSKWWPAWAELQEDLDFLARPRKLKLAAIVDYKHRGLWDQQDSNSAVVSPSNKPEKDFRGLDELMGRVRAKLAGATNEELDNG